MTVKAALTVDPDSDICAGKFHSLDFNKISDIGTYYLILPRWRPWSYSRHM